MFHKCSNTFVSDAEIFDNIQRRFYASVFTIKKNIFHSRNTDVDILFVPDYFIASYAVCTIRDARSALKNAFCSVAFAIAVHLFSFSFVLPAQCRAHRHEGIGSSNYDDLTHGNFDRAT